MTEYDGTHEERSDRFTAIEDRFAGYTVYDQNYDKIGKVDDLFVDENDQPEYIGVKMGFLGTRSTLIPMNIAQVDDAGSRIEVATDKDTVKSGPSFDDDREITPDFENEVYSYYGLQSTDERGSYDAYPTETTDEDELRIQRSEEVTVDRVPVEGEASETEIGDDEVSIPVTEEEVVVEKRPVAKEEIRIRKDVVEDTEVVEEDVRKEEVDVDDQSGRLER
jgi:uncharacterized protein (TIGR02271 family)